MISTYDIGDTILLTATIIGIEQSNNGEVLYRIREYDRPVAEDDVLCRIADGWKVLKKEQFFTKYAVDEGV